MIDVSDPVQIALAFWGGAGMIVALAFLAFGIDRIDDAAKGAYAVRPLLLPGLVILWPLVLWRWVALSRTRNRETGA